LRELVVAVVIHPTWRDEPRIEATGRWSPAALLRNVVKKFPLDGQGIEPRATRFVPIPQLNRRAALNWRGGSLRNRGLKSD